MTKNTTAHPSVKLPYPILGFLRISGNQIWDYAIVGIAAVGVFTILIYEIVWQQSIFRSEINFSPGDIVYGEKIHAVHDMNQHEKPKGVISPYVAEGESPIIRVSETFYDFGEVNAQQPLIRTFVISNIGKSPLIIERAYTTCGCTVADFSAKEVPPGKVAMMVLQFDPGYHDLSNTTVRRGVIIETNDPEQPVLEIWVQASIR